MVVCDGLTGLPEAIAAVWPQTDRADLRGPPAAQQLPVRLQAGLGGASPRTSSRSTPRRPRPPRWTRFAELRRHLGAALPGDREAVGERLGGVRARSWRFDPEIRTVICTTNAIESLNARFRRSVKARGHFPTEQAALKHLYLAIMQPRSHRPRAGNAGPTAGRPH